MLRELRGALDDFRNALRGAGVAAADTLADPPPAPDASAAAAAESAAPSGVVTAPGADDDDARHDAADSRPDPATRRWFDGWRWTAVAATVVVVIVLLRGAPWEAREPADAEVVATFQGGTVTREQLLRQWRALPAEDRPLFQTAAGLRTLVGHLAIEASIRRWAEEQQLDQRETFKDALKHATEGIQLDDVFQQLHEGRIPVGEAEIQAYYDENRQRFGDRPLVEVREQIRRAVVEQKEQTFIADYLTELRQRASLQVDYGLLDVPEPSQPELAAYYEANRERFRLPEQVMVAQIQVSVSLAGGDDQARARAEGARARAAAGEDFGQLARELSDGPERARGGTLAGAVARGLRGPAFDAAVFSLQIGDLSAVFKEGDSYYVVKPLARHPEQLRSYEEVRGQIAATLRAERERQVYAERAGRTLFTMRARRTTLGEFLQELDELPPEVQARYAGPAVKRQLLDSFIDRLLVIEDAAAQAADVKRSAEIEHARTELLAQLLHEAQVDDQVRVSDDEVRAEYERNRSRYAEPPRVRVRYIRVTRGTTVDADRKARAKIEEAATRVRPGGLFGRGDPAADFAAVAREYSEDAATAARGGEYDAWITEDGDLPTEGSDHALHAALLPLAVGEISPILPLYDSYYLFQIREKQEARPRALEEAAPLVRQLLEEQKHADLTQRVEETFLGRMQLRIYDGRIQRVLADLGGPPAGTR